MERIVRALSAEKKISDWRILHVRTQSYQMYVIQDRLDTIRKVVTGRYQVMIYCDHDGLRGSTTIILPDQGPLSLEKHIRNAVYIAGRVGNPQYSLPSPSHVPFVETFDPALLGDIQNILFVRMADRLIDSVESEKNVELSSSEYFLDLKDYHMINSRGIDATFRKSDLFFDGVLLAKDHEQQVEIHFEPRAGRLQDLDVETIIRQQAQMARDSLRAGLPSSGNYPVVFSGNAVSSIFSPLVFHTSAGAIYRKTSQLTPGFPLVSERGEGSGEKLTLLSNGFMPFGLKTYPIDFDGIPACRVELIREGIFSRPWSTQQYADYLGIAPTGALSNLEIPIGPNSKQDLLKETGPVLEVVEFSAMMPDPVSGGFAAEIKLGYEHRNGEVRPVRGGSVSGNLLAGFRSVFFSTQSQTIRYALTLDDFGTYSGPESIRFETFQVAGN